MTKMLDVCPQCSSHLVLKDGQFGEFLACPRFPECRFTRPLKETEELYKTPSLYCSKCGETGLLPFTKNGKVISDTFVDCECKLSLSEHFDPVRPHPSDFDFAMSDTFRAFTYEHCNQPDPTPYYLDKKFLQPNEYNNNLYYNREGATNFVGRYLELPALGELGKRLKEVELKLKNYQFKQKTRQEDGF